MSALLLNNLTNQFLAMAPAQAKAVVGALSLNAKDLVSLIDQDGDISPQKHRVSSPVTAGLVSNTSYDNKPFFFVDGVAVIPAQGMLYHKYHGSNAWVTGYDYLVSCFDAANEDMDVKGILFLINSPGGTVAGCFDACDHIAENKGNKPVWAVYDDMACSGAMCIASAADKRLTTQTASSGSIGVVQVHASYEDMLNEAGLRVTLIHSGSHKVDGNPYKNLPDEVFKQFKTQCDALRASFANKVANNIGLDIDAVLNTEAQVYTGQKAVDVGLADEVINPHNVLAYFTESLPTLSNNTLNSNEDTNSMAHSENNERARRKAIINSEAAQGREDLAKHLAFDTDNSVDSALAILNASPKVDATAETNPLDAWMASIEQPNIMAMGEVPEPSEEDQAISTYRKVTGA